MGIADRAIGGVVEKQWVKIVTVDPRSRRIEGMLKDFAIIQISVWEVAGNFRWPIEGEWWIVVRENGNWFLRAPRQELQDESDPDADRLIEDLEPGDSVQGHKSARVYVEGNLVTRNGVTMKATAGVPTDAIFDAPPEPGTLAINTVNDQLYYREDNGTWTTTTAGALSAHAASHLPGGSDALTTAVAGTIQPDDAAAVGTAASFARSDHKHAIVAATAIDLAGTASAEGSSTSFARADHHHAYGAASIPNTALVGGASYMRDIGEHCFAYSTSGTSITNGSSSTIAMQAELYDVTSDGGNDMHDNSTNNDRVYVRRDGIYTCNVYATDLAGGGFGCEIQIRVDGVAVAYAGETNFIGSGRATANVAIPPRNFTDGQYFTFWVSNGTGSTITPSCHMSVNRIGGIV